MTSDIIDEDARGMIRDRMQWKHFAYRDGVNWSHKVVSHTVA